MIPKKLHYIWIGKSEFPARFKANIESWRRHNPDFEICLWTEANLDWSARYMRAAYMLKYWSRVTNLARLQILQRHGGIYLDVDVEAVRPFAPLLDNQCFLGFQDGRPDANWVNGAVFGAVPGHWFVEAAIARMLADFTGTEPLDSSHGPGHVVYMLKRYGLDRCHEDGTWIRDIRLYPRRAFYPYHWTEAFHPSAVKPDTFMIHHWAASWVDPPAAHEAKPPRTTWRAPLDEINKRIEWQMQKRLGADSAALKRYRGLRAAILAARFDRHRSSIVGEAGRE